MLKKWIVLHRSYGIPRAIYQLQKYMEFKEIDTKIETSRTSHFIEYRLFVREDQLEEAKVILQKFKDNAST